LEGLNWARCGLSIFEGHSRAGGHWRRLIAHSKAVTPADRVSLNEQGDRIGVRRAVESNRLASDKTDIDGLCFDDAVVAPERHAHNGIHDLDAAVEALQVLGFVSSAQKIAVGRVRSFIANIKPSPQILTSSCFIACTSMVPVTAANSTS
jgi:hypothetical protein